MPDITPPSSPSEPDSPQPKAESFFMPEANSAADLIREKLNRIYSQEPDAQTEIQEAEAESAPERSPHQQFMHELSTSGKNLATIQTEWHNYYVSLSDKQKHEVWQEFYSSNANTRLRPIVNPPIKAQDAPAPIDAQAIAEHKHQARATTSYKTKLHKVKDKRTPEAIRATIRNQVTANGKLTAKHHIQSLLFGLGMGAIVIFIFLFGFFNEVIIAPFIQPSRDAAATPIIVDSSSIASTPTPQVIIPKINVQIPTDYSQTSTDEATIENALENGVVHYPTTALPGQQGNAAFFGHSSNNIFNKGKYKFAFVLLHLLVPGDTFYLSYNEKVYVYKVITKKVVEPTQVDVLNAVPGQIATATLITCDPPGTSLKRLIIVGQQISPDPSGNTASVTTPTLGANAVTLPGNGPTLAGRVLRSTAGKTIATILVVGAIIVTIRWINKPKRR